jgi:hypothetical protein
MSAEPRKPKDVEMTPDVEGSVLGVDVRKHGSSRDVCPVCREKLSRVALVSLAYTYEPCDCPAAPYVHLVEQLWHRKHVDQPR